MATLYNSLNDFFSYLKVMSNEWCSKSKESQVVITGLKNQSEQLRLVRRVNWSKDLIIKFPDIQGRLLNKIKCGLEEETVQLNDIWKHLLSLKKKLKSKLDSIERCAYKVNASSDSNDNILPSPNELMLNAENCFRHYNSLCIQMTYALGSLNYEDEKTILRVEEVFLKSSVIENSVKDHLALWNVSTDLQT